MKLYTARIKTERELILSGWQQTPQSIANLVDEAFLHYDFAPSATRHEAQIIGQVAIYYPMVDFLGETVTLVPSHKDPNTQMQWYSDASENGGWSWREDMLVPGTLQEVTTND